MGAVAGESNSDLVALTDEVDEFDAEVWEAVSDPCRTLLELREIEFLFAVVMDIVRRHQLIEPIPLASVVRIEKPVEDLPHERSIFAGRLSHATSVVHRAWVTPTAHTVEVATLPALRPASAEGRILGRVATPRLVFLYGPPAVGKLTVARAIADRLPFKILHNHVTIDAVTEVLPFGSDTFWRVVGRFRRDLVEAAAGENIDLIYTFVFAPGDEQHVADVVSPYEKAGGVVSFVQLLAPREVLLQRVLAESRRQYGKPTDAETLTRLLDEYDCFTAMPDRDSLTIDLAATSARDAADRIIGHIGAG